VGGKNTNSVSFSVTVKKEDATGYPYPSGTLQSTESETHIECRYGIVGGMMHSTASMTGLYGFYVTVENYRSWHVYRIDDKKLRLSAATSKGGGSSSEPICEFTVSAWILDSSLTDIVTLLNSRVCSSATTINVEVYYIKA
jgi:hypothetical protein